MWRAMGDESGHWSAVLDLAVEMPRKRPLPGSLRSFIFALERAAFGQQRSLGFTRNDNVFHEIFAHLSFSA
jgi:hypothetical protein